MIQASLIQRLHLQLIFARTTVHEAARWMKPMDLFVIFMVINQCDVPVIERNNENRSSLLVQPLISSNLMHLYGCCEIMSCAVPVLYYLRRHIIHAKIKAMFYVPASVRSHVYCVCVVYFHFFLVCTASYAGITFTRSMELWWLSTFFERQDINCLDRSISHVSLFS